MTLDDLVKAANDAVRAAGKGDGFSDRIMVRAVVKALRDELEHYTKYRIGAQPWLLVARLEEILGEAGEKGAGTDTAKPEAIERSIPATDPAPVNVAKMQRTLLRKWRKAKEAQR